jgi:hypothetical protein
METDAAVEKQKPVFPQRLAKRLLAFRTVPTGSTTVKLTNKNRTLHLLPKPDIFTCYRQRGWNSGDTHRIIA